jgi:hypothetical protein
MSRRASAALSLTIAVALFGAGTPTLAQGPAATQAPPAQNASEQDVAAVRQAAYDYAEGFYEGAADRMERAVHPAVVKRGVVPASRDVPSLFLQRMSAEMLVATARSGIGKKTPADGRKLTFALLDLRGDVASAKIFTVGFNDYLQLAKQDGRWRIVNVLWMWPRADAAVNAEADGAAIGQAIKEYYDGLAAFAAERVERVVHPEATLRAFSEDPAGKPYVVESTRDAVVEAVRAKATKAPAAPTITVQDVYGDVASALVTSGSTVSYWHMLKQDGRWRLVNRLSRTAPATAAR